MDIEPYINSPESLLTLCQNVISALDAKNNGAELDDLKQQLREISHAIDKLEKAGVQVPETWRSSKIELVSRLACDECTCEALKKLANGFSIISEELNIKISKWNGETKQSFGKVTNIEGHRKLINQDRSQKGQGQLEFKI
jgi:hypothetical protein